MTAVTSPARPRTDTKRRILEAAEEVVLRDGVARLTLEATAAEAGLSKGGVLYHFPTRDALVAGMIAAIVEAFEDDVDRHLPAAAADGSRPPGAFTRAYLRATVEPAGPSRPTVERRDRLGAALIAAAAAEPSLLAPLQADFDRCQERLDDDGLDPVVATLVRLASDGLWLSDLFGLAPVDDDRRRRVAALLESLTGSAPC